VTAKQVDKKIKGESSDVNTENDEDVDDPTIHTDKIIAKKKESGNFIGSCL